MWTNCKFQNFNHSHQPNCDFLIKNNSVSEEISKYTGLSNTKLI